MVQNHNMRCTRNAVITTTDPKVTWHGIDWAMRSPDVAFRADIQLVAHRAVAGEVCTGYDPTSGVPMPLDPRLLQGRTTRELLSITEQEAVAPAA